jgi:hypothetical protein
LQSHEGDLRQWSDVPRRDDDTVVLRQRERERENVCVCQLPERMHFKEVPMRWFLPLMTLTAGCAEEVDIRPSATHGPGLLALTAQEDPSTTADAVIQQADVVAVREGADIQVVVAEDITHDMYVRPISELAQTDDHLTICWTHVPAVELVEEVRSTPKGTYITCSEPISVGSADSMTVRGDLVHDTMLLDIKTRVPNTHEYYHLLEVVTADPTETNTEVEVR